MGRRQMVVYYGASLMLTLKVLVEMVMLVVPCALVAMVMLKMM